MAEATFLQSSRVFFLAFIAYWGIVLFGYDTGVAGSVVAQTHFQHAFGIFGDKKKTADVSSNVVSVLQAGAFFGALGSAPVSSRIGRKNTLLAFSVIFLVGAILTTVAGGGSKGLGEIYAGRVISGLGIGGISAVAPAFVSECSPKSLRGTITGLFQVGVAIGVMLSYFINYGISLNPRLANGPTVWRIPFGFQLVPAGIMFTGLFIVKESPRWLASVGRVDEALTNLAYYRKLPATHPDILHEFAEIEAAIREEKEARASVGLKAAFLAKGNRIRFLIAFVIFLLQQWSGQNSVGYYAPQIFASIGYTGPKNSLLASGIYGVVKVVATALFILTTVDTLGRKLSLIISAAGMGTMFFIVGALLKTHPPPATSSTDQVLSISPASQAMAAMLYIYVVFYSLGWGPLPWVYVSDIFPTATRHYGLALASATQWLFNFNLSKVTPQMVNDLGYKIFFMFAAINIGGMLTFSCIIPETKGRSLEDMDVIFGAVSAEKRREDIRQQEQVIAHTEVGSATGQEDEKV
jgi:sugar porter (SP) family MFS transporter